MWGDYMPGVWGGCMWGVVRVGCGRMYDVHSAQPASAPDCVVHQQLCAKNASKHAAITCTAIGKEELILQHDKVSGRVVMRIEQVSKPNQQHKPDGMLKVCVGVGALLLPL